MEVIDEVENLVVHNPGAVRQAETRMEGAQTHLIILKTVVNVRLKEKSI